MEKEVLSFINHRWGKDSNWINGNCLWFAIILSTRFPQFQITYLPIQGHFAVTDGTEYYDWTGKIYPTETAVLLNDIKSNDFKWYSRLLRDCFC